MEFGSYRDKNWRRPAGEVRRNKAEGTFSTEMTGLSPSYGHHFAVLKSREKWQKVEFKELERESTAARAIF